MDLISRTLKGAPATLDALAALFPDADTHADTAPRPPGRYDRLVDALNRLPRPALAYGALALMAFAMFDPAGFVQRMQALQSAPTELWWLLGAVIAGHFGAREAHHMRHRPARQAAPRNESPAPPAPAAAEPE
ncbi:3TM-type holin [Paragemmobacter ruber]|uniref:Methionine synthase I n=1 Tax=Paragemmobacter ruber TaxID=1985673 RepID=A0ABW9Y7K9_9RHOB|nr:3TM-type holin [Rhodobacter ruber]NBE08498.1 hypothetical protein [Rhodobacter ruber]